MTSFAKTWLLQITVLLLSLSIQSWLCSSENEDNVKSAVFLSPKFQLGPGSVENKFYYNIDFPKGHIALKSFDAEVIDADGNPIPLHETYLHHWVVARYYARKKVETDNYNKKDAIFVRNSGICQGNALGQYFGLGSETRKTDTRVPDPYGIEIGNPKDIPSGFEERWMLNVHAIDTRGVEDRMGCTECLCDLYNVTVDEYGRRLKPEYKGGLLCCYDQTQCRVKQGFQGSRRDLYLKYTVKWVDMDASILPVKIYILDITDKWTKSKDSSVEHHCRVEYDVESCSSNGVGKNSCVDTRRSTFPMPVGGYVVYGVSHQHSGGIGSTLYKEDGQVICSSIPTYGKGHEPGNEAGYIVGMSTCYPQPGSIKISKGETLRMEANYNNSRGHTGVMSLFMILVAEHLPANFIHTKVHDDVRLSSSSSMVIGVGVLIVAIAVVVAVLYRRKNKEESGYQSLMT